MSRFALFLLLFSKMLPLFQHLISFLEAGFLELPLEAWDTDSKVFEPLEMLLLRDLCILSTFHEKYITVVFQLQIRCK
jgi:hypothetical protein